MFFLFLQVFTGLNVSQTFQSGSVDVIGTAGLDELFFILCDNWKMLFYYTN